MLKRSTLAACAAIALLSACQKKAEPPPGFDDPNSENFSDTAKPVALPPMPKSSKAYRCDDQSVVNIQLFQGDLQANVSEEKGPPTVLKAEAAGKPFVAEGFELTVKGDAVTLTRPGHPKQSCSG
jgi:hypothetical protein